MSRRCAGRYRPRQQRLADGGGQGDGRARHLHVGGSCRHQAHQDVRLGGQLQTTGDGTTCVEVSACGVACLYHIVSIYQTLGRIFSIQFNLVSESFDSDSNHDSQSPIRIDSNQLTIRNGLLEFHSNLLMTQMVFQNFDSNRLTTQKTFRNIDSNQLITPFNHYPWASVSLDLPWYDLFWACPIPFDLV